jgi:hypothetical protein
MTFLSKVTIFLSVLFLSNFVETNQIYLFQSGDSCCLHFKGVDIANPHVPCTGHVPKDLMGIFEYITRLLKGDKLECGERDFLIEVQRYIASLFTTRAMYISYRLNIHRNVDLYHEALEKKKKYEAFLAKKKKDNTKDLESAEKVRKEKQLQEDMKNLGLIVQRLNNKKK